MWTLEIMTCEILGWGSSGYPGGSSWLYPLPGDCWFLAALGSLTQNPASLQKIMPVQSFSHQYAGIFCFRVCFATPYQTKFPASAGRLLEST